MSGRKTGAGRPGRPPQTDGKRRGPDGRPGVGPPPADDDAKRKRSWPEADVHDGADPGHGNRVTGRERDDPY